MSRRARRGLQVVLRLMLPALLGLLAGRRPGLAQTPADTLPLTILGKVVGLPSGEPLMGAVIRIEGLATVVSREGGEFRLEGIRPGTLRVVVTCLGYQRLETDVAFLRSGSLVLPLVSTEPPPGGGEPGAIRGRVRVAGGNEGAEGAAVTLPGLGLTRIADRTGAFTFPEVRPGIHVITVGLLGYATRGDSVEVLPGRITELDVPLSIEPIPIEGITVTARSRWIASTGLYRRLENRNAYTGRVWTREEIEKVDPVFVQDLVENVPGVSYDPVEGYRTQARRCRLAVYVDDAPMPGFDLRLLEPRQIEAIEVYYGGMTRMPVEYGYKHCGVILVWLRH